jgi:hypothetical protein
VADHSKNGETRVMVRMVRFNATIHGVAAGTILGLGTFVATNWLVLKGGPIVGPHLALLGQFYIGYRVTFLGSFIGLAYGFVLGFLLGYAGAVIYNTLRDLRSRP